MAAFTSTTLAGAVSATAPVLYLASATGVEVGSILRIGQEACRVTAISGTKISVQRGWAGTRTSAHEASAVVYEGESDQYAADTWQPLNVIPAAGGKSFDKTSAGTYTLLPAAVGDRRLLICYTVTETLDDGDGGQPTFKIGETGATEKFLAAATLTDDVAGTGNTLLGTLSSDTALIVTATALTGTTDTGAIDVAFLVVPDV
jgi:hypothetical protein